MIIPWRPAPIRSCLRTGYGLSVKRELGNTAELGRNWLLLGLAVVLGFADIINGGVTSSFVRNSDLVHDMPLDSDVFKIPRGYNAP
ncbi:unnamed protein product [Linum trigynum]|uniref:Uncharacterized protein n=1 Tax=Linum trigynum TaxID=586398 RepID=A0AAV2EEC4_9ROSI